MEDKFICRYCGKECKNANSLRNHERLCKSNPNHQISNFVAYNKQCTDSVRTIWNKGLTKETDKRLKRRGEKLHERFIRGELVPHNLGKHHTEAEKRHLSEVRKAYLKEHPEKVPYKLNHHSKQSYPERYFEIIFNNDDILKQFEKEFPVGLYSLDFAIPNIKFYVEIDGEQHYLDKRIVEHDKIRTENLEKLGWKGFRIRWSEYVKLKLEERQSIIQQIKDLVVQ